jgi:hypothetical protein
MMRGQTGRMFDAVCRVCLKHLAGGTLDPQAKRLARLQLQRKAAASFDFKSPGYKQNLLGALRYGPSAGIVARFLFAWCGLGSDRFQRVRTACYGPEHPENGQSSNLAAGRKQNA